MNNNNNNTDMKKIIYLIYGGWLTAIISSILVLCLVLINANLLKKIENKEAQIEHLSYESVRYKLMYEDLYNTYIYPNELIYEEEHYDK